MKGLSWDERVLAVKGNGSCG